MANENIDIKQIWKSAPSGQKKITKGEIAEFKRKKQNSVYTSLQSTCLIQVFQKIVYFVALFFGLFIFGNKENITLAIFIILLFNLVLLGIDFRTLSRIRTLKHAEKAVADSLKQLERFLQTDFYLYRFYAAFSNPVLIITGILYYSYFKYGHFNMLNEADSLIVFGTIILISFIIGYIGMVFSSNKIMSEIRSYMEILEDTENYQKIMEKDKKRRLRYIMLMLFILVAGLLSFLLILIK